MSILSITLPLPDRKLSPNSRTHWRAKAAAVKKARMLAAIMARAARLNPPRWEQARVRYDFRLPDKRRRDADNLEASMKAYMDGLRDAGVIVDDCYARLTREPSTFTVDRANQGVTVSIEPIAAREAA